MRFLVYFTHVLLFANYCDAFNTAANKSVQQVYCASPLNWRRASSIAGSPAVQTLNHATPTGGMDEAGHSFVEGETFDNRFAEIEAMGGGTYNNCFVLCLF